MTVTALMNARGWWSLGLVFPFLCFRIWLNSRDRITGEDRILSVTGDTPEWGNWKLVEEEDAEDE